MPRVRRLLANKLMRVTFNCPVIRQNYIFIEFLGELSRGLRYNSRATAAYHVKSRECEIIRITHCSWPLERKIMIHFCYRNNLYMKAPNPDVYEISINFVATKATIYVIQENCSFTMTLEVYWQGRTFHLYSTIFLLVIIRCMREKNEKTLYDG
jgi:hypothetical protein